MKRIALLFAGQGAQYPGMGKDVYQKHGFVREMFSEASAILGYDLAEMCFSENELLNQTENTQPAITAVNCSLYEVLKREDIIPTAALGFSLGEYSALYAAGVFSFPTVISLVKERARCMAAVARKRGGAMVAIIGLGLEGVKAACAASGSVIANHNSPSQYVIAGEEEEVRTAVEKALALGARRAVRLNVSGAFHHPLMREAAQCFKPNLEKADWNPPSFPVIMNCNASELRFEELTDLLEMQIYSPVLFEKSVRRLVEELNIDAFLEIGPGKVLSSLVRRIVPGTEVYNFEKASDLELIKEVLDVSER